MLDQAGSLKSGGREIIEPLLQAAQDADSVIAGRARDVLHQLENPAAQDELCRWVIETAQPIAAEAALAAGYFPRDPQPRALFFLLTEQWDRYTRLDFDASLLRAIYAAGDAHLRSQIATLARKAGWSGFVEAVAGSRLETRSEKRLAELTDLEWDVILALLGATTVGARSGSWPRLRRLTGAPACCAPSTLPAGFQSALKIARVLSDLSQAAERSLLAGTPIEKFASFHATLEGHTRPVTALALTPDGSLLASASADQTVRLWRLPAGEPLRTLENHTGYVLSLAISPDGRLLASGSADKTVRLWQLPEGDLLQILSGHPGEVTHLAISAGRDEDSDRLFLASGSERSIHIWDLPSGSLLSVLKGDTSGLAGLCILPDGQTLIGGDQDKTVRLWQFPNGGLRRALLDTIIGWSVSPDGNLLASGKYLWRGTAVAAALR